MHRKGGAPQFSWKACQGKLLLVIAEYSWVRFIAFTTNISVTLKHPLRMSLIWMKSFRYYLYMHGKTAFGMKNRGIGMRLSIFYGCSCKTIYSTSNVQTDIFCRAFYTVLFCLSLFLFSNQPEKRYSWETSGIFFAILQNAPNAILQNSSIVVGSLRGNKIIEVVFWFAQFCIVQTPDDDKKFTWLTINRLKKVS